MSEPGEPGGPGEWDGIDFSVPDDPGRLVDALSDPLPSEAGTIQVRSGIGPEAGAPYVATISVTDDVSMALTRHRAAAYARAVLEVAARADYMAAVTRQMRRVMGNKPPAGGLDTEESVNWFVQQLVEELPDLDGEATWPLVFEPGRHRPTDSPLVAVFLTQGSQQRVTVGHWSPASARHHARGVLDAAVYADLDTTYRGMLKGVIGIDEQRSRAIIANLSEYLADSEEDPKEAGEDAIRRSPRVVPPAPGARPTQGKKPRRRGHR